jgi:hypothetical protein
LISKHKFSKFWLVRGTLSVEKRLKILGGDGMDDREGAAPPAPLGAKGALTGVVRVRPPPCR